MIKAVIFDLGNVLINFDHRIAAKRIFEFTDKSPSEIYNLFFDSGITAMFEEGRISAEDFFLKIKAMLNLKIDYQEFISIWNGIFFLTENNKEVYTIVKNLRNKYRIALLSNINVLHFDYLKKEFPVFDAFHCVITSFEVGARKPHPLIYAETLECLNVASPAEAFYTDDRQELIEKAKELGINSAVFRDAKQLRQDLEQAGVNIN